LAASQTIVAAPRTSVKPGVNPWAVALTVTLARFMELLDTSVANVSLPYIAGGLGRSFDEVTWIPDDLSGSHCRRPAAECVA
jgi:DHA2 family multidrug resistance protein